MTKYVVNSGGVSNFPEKAKLFFAEICKGLGKSPKLLLCYFAQPREIWEQKFKQDTIDFIMLFPEGVKPIFEMASTDVFEQQCRTTEIIYIKGGDDHLLQYWLKQFNIPIIWDGKVVATNSAGSDALATHFWTCDWRQVMDGLGVLEIKFIPHFKSEYGNNDPRGLIDWEKSHKELESYGDTSLPIYALEEGDYVVIEK
jgi:hypothetical protein